MILLNKIDCVIKDFIKCTEDYLIKNEKIKNLDRDYTLEFYLNNTLEYERDVKQGREIIAGCLTVYEQFLHKILNEQNIEGFEKFLNKSDFIQILQSPSGVISFNLELKVDECNCYFLDIYVYEKRNRKEEILKYISDKKLNNEQGKYILDMFKENEVFSKNLDSILEDLKEEISSSICRFSLKNLIKDNGYTILDLVNQDLSEDILGLISKSSNIYRVYKDVISVVKREDGYSILFCDDVIHEIKYNLELFIQK